MMRCFSAVPFAVFRGLSPSLFRICPQPAVTIGVEATVSGLLESMGQ